MEKYSKDGTKVNLALENELCAKSYDGSYKNNGEYINFENVRVYFKSRGATCNYYLLFATTGSTNIWYGIVDWSEYYYGITTVRLIPLYDSGDIQPGIRNNIGTVNFNSKDTFYQVTPVGI